MTDSVLISGVGVVSPLGRSMAEHLQGLWSKQHGFRRITTYDTTAAEIVYAGEVQDLTHIALPNRKLQKLLNRKDLLGIAAAHAALLDADMQSDGRNPDRHGVFIGSCSTQIGDFIPYFETAPACIGADGLSFDSNRFGRDCLNDINPLAAVKVLLNGCLAHVSQQFNIQGANTSVMDGEVSGLKALRMASNAIKRGELDWALVGAMTAPLDPFQMGQAKAKGLLAPQKGLACEELQDAVRPFDTAAIGTLLSEGAVFFVLESELSYQRRKAPKPAYARLLGMTESVCTGADKDAGMLKCLQKMRSHLSAGKYAPGLFITNNVGESNGDNFTAYQLMRVLAHFPAQIAVTNLSGQSGYLAEASGLLSLVHGMSMLDKRIALPVTNLRESSASAASLPLLKEPRDLAACQVLTANTNIFGQTALCAIEPL